MANGFHALKGFEYQTTVTLDLLLEHFHRRKEHALARPEGHDDLVIRRPDLPADQDRRFYQIKKPREDSNGETTGEAWSLSSAVRELLSGTVARLRDNKHEQTWILGDAVDAAVDNLVAASEQAPDVAADDYVVAIHLLARDEAALLDGVPQREGRALGRWRPNAMGATPQERVDACVQSFITEAKAAGVSDAVCQAYRDAASAFHAVLPDVLGRTHLQTTYGTEATIRDRIRRDVVEHYRLPEATVHYTLLRNLRGFVADIATQMGRWVSAEEFELELRCVWPQMTLMAEPPALRTTDLPRPNVVGEIAALMPRRAAEVLGASGSGKTTLARAVYEELRCKSDRLVLYAEVRRDHHFRDVLAGVAFHARRAGLSEPFQVAVRPAASDESAIHDLATAFSLAETPIAVLADLVEGNCGEAFAHDLAIFTRCLEPENFCVLLFGQGSALRALSALDRQALDIPSPVNVPGIDFDEFAELVGHFHSSADRGQLWKVFESLTAGRSTGLLAGLADVLARSPSVERIQELTTMAPEDVLNEAERRRYDDITPTLRSAADRLLCFALPFSLEEAQTLFPNESVAAAVSELLQRGMLRHHDDTHFELHEVVRRGLESRLPPSLKRETHSVLATHYLQLRDVTATIHHLEQAERISEAHQVARDAFLAGTKCQALAAYVGRHHLFSGDDIAAWFRADPIPAHLYLAETLLSTVGCSSTATTLLQIIADNPARFDTDFSWGWHACRALLACDPTQLHALVEFGLAKAPPSERLVTITAAARRSPIQVNDLLLARFKTSDATDKGRLLPLLLLDNRRAVLGPALAFVASGASQEVGDVSFDKLEVLLNDRASVVELLAAVPLAETTEMIARRSPLLGRLEPLVWNQRHTLRTECLSILEAETVEDVILENAMRVLVFLGEDGVIAAAERFLGRKTRLATFAALLPIFLPQAPSLESYRARLLDTTRDPDNRMRDFAVLSQLDNPDELLQQLTASDPERRRLWEFLLLMRCVQRPFVGAIPLIEQALAECKEESQSRTLSLLVGKLGELPGDVPRDFVLRMLENAWPSVRFHASLCLQTRREKTALPSLIDLCVREPEPRIAQMALVAAICCGPTSEDAFAGVWSRVPELSHWRFVLAARLRAPSIAGEIISVAIDSSRHWQLRRAALLAATHLPFGVALEKIAPSVLAETSPFSIDHHHALLGHHLVSFLLREELEAITSRFAEGRPRFAVFGDILEEWKKQSMFGGEGMPSGQAAATWLFDRLEHHRCGEDAGAVDRVQGELHIPILHAAVLRGFRMSGRYDLIENAISTGSTEWIIIRSLSEWRRGRFPSAGDVARLSGLVANTGFANSPYMRNCIKNISERAPRPAATGATGGPTHEPAVVTRLTFEMAKTAIEAGQLNVTGATALELSEPQCIELARLTAPRPINSARWVTTLAALAFTTSGFTVRGARQETRPGEDSVLGTLRPLVAAANRFGVRIPWHAELLADTRAHVGHSYVAAFLTSLGALGDADRFYEELNAHSALILPQCVDTRRFQPVRSFLDARVAPIILRHANMGQDDLLQCLCWIASHVSDPAIDAALQALFTRWINRFVPKAQQQQHAGNHFIWRAFRLLVDHPRFSEIPGHDLRLMDLLALNMAWYNKNDLIEVIARSPRAYVRLESLLIRAAPFEHFARDEVDRLEEAAERLFPL